MEHSLTQFRNVVDGGYCIGCGICAVHAPNGISIKLDEFGRYQAQLSEPENFPDDFASICPFSGSSENEDEISKRAFKDSGVKSNEFVGSYINCYAGNSKVGTYRENGSSGGLTSWLLTEMMELGLIDGVIHVSPKKDDLLFEYAISTEASQVSERSKSRYYPIEMSGVLSKICELDGKFALVGIPCFIKASHLLAKANPQIAGKIAYRIGIVCGHLKSAAFSEYLHAQTTTKKSDLAEIDFRHKLTDRMASQYAVRTKSRDEIETVTPMSEVYGGNWGYGFFKYDACNYCDDVLAETADVAFGDAWLPEYASDWRGTNVAVTRSQVIDEIFQNGLQSKALELDTIPVERVEFSQLGGLRDRREGLSHRLLQKDTEGSWRPKKRVKSSSAIPKKRRKVYDLRLAISSKSHLAYASAKQHGDIRIFDQKMRPLTDAYDKLYQPSLTTKLLSLPGRVLGKLKRTLLRDFSE